MAENLHSIALVPFLPRIKVITHIFIVIVIVVIVVGVIIIVIFELVIVVIGCIATHRGSLATIDRRGPSSVSGTFSAPEVHIRVILVRIRGVCVTIAVCYRRVAAEEIVTAGVWGFRHGGTAGEKSMGVRWPRTFCVG